MELGVVPLLNLSHSLACPAMRTVPAKKVVLDVLVGKLGEENLHLVIKTGIVGWSTHDETLVAEDVAQDVAVVSLRDIMEMRLFTIGTPYSLEMSSPVFTKSLARRVILL